MSRFAAKLGETHHVSVLLRRARRFMPAELGALISLAVQRGCSHYREFGSDVTICDPGSSVLSDEELAVLLLLGEHASDATAVRCAAQLLGGGQIDARRVARLARMERCERVLAYIARAGWTHDEKGRVFWSELLTHLGNQRPYAEGLLPHWTRFALVEGVQRNVRTPRVTWLRPRR